MGKRMTVGSRAVAVAIVAEMLEQADEAARAKHQAGPTYQTTAEELVTLAWDVEYKPNAEKLVLILNAGIEAPDRFRSTPEDHPPLTPVPDSTDQ